MTIAATSSSEAAGSDPALPRPLWSRISMTWLVLSSVAIVAVFVGQYMTATLQTLATHHAGLASTYADRAPFFQVAFYLHIGFAGVALALGPLQFLGALRNRYRRVHRVIGRVYLISVLIGALAALVMSTINSAGINGFFGFGSLAVLWAYVSFTGYRAIRARDIASHRAWMMRSFALTYAAVTLRLWLGVLIAVQLPFSARPFDFMTVFDNAYAPLPWIAWIPNLVIAELLIRKAGLPGLRLSRAGTEVPG